ncbi:MAG: ATPase, T2SS/T4P/T4SS family [Patescibacteria group bacterium]|jgi:type IV pilus assembly protein PilB
MSAWPIKNETQSRVLKLLSTLVDLGFVKSEVIDNLRAELKPLPSEVELVEYLVKHLIADYDQINRAYATLLKLPYLQLPQEVNKASLIKLPKAVCEEKQMVVYGTNDKEWDIAVAKPALLQESQSGVLTKLSKAEKIKYKIVITSPDSIKRWLNQYPDQRTEDGGQKTESSLSFRPGELVRATTLEKSQERIPSTLANSEKAALIGRAIDPKVLHKIPVAIAKDVGIIAYQFRDNVFEVATVDPMSQKVLNAVHYIQDHNNVKINLHHTSRDDIDYAISQYGLHDRIFNQKNLSGQKIDHELLLKIPYNVAKKYRFVVFGKIITSQGLTDNSIYQVASDNLNNAEANIIWGYIEKNNGVTLYLYPTDIGSIDYALSLYPETTDHKEQLALPGVKKAEWLLPPPVPHNPVPATAAVVKPQAKPNPQNEQPLPPTDIPEEKPSFWPKWLVSLFGGKKDNEIIISEDLISPPGTVPNAATSAMLGNPNPTQPPIPVPTKPAEVKPPEQKPPSPAPVPPKPPEEVAIEQKTFILKTKEPYGAKEKEAAPKPVGEEDEDNLGSLLDHDVTTLEELQKIIQEGFVPRVVAALVSYAITLHASDVHIEAEEKDVRVRYRVDGMLQDVMRLPVEQHAAIISRIKILSKLKIDETRIPQDGRFDVAFKDRAVDLRVSSMPTVHGEKIVMRILDKTHGIMSLEDLGVLGRAFDIVIEAIKKPYGIVLSTGPTGSGKSTTLYAILNRISVPTVNVITLEDPVEYEIAGVNQAQIKPKIGFTFAEGLRSVLRQDPNIVMVGEIRDAETASMATHAALTGHLVLSTLHTNDAPGALPRLINMGIEPFLITSSINCVEAQRLVRRICPNCKEEVELPETVIKEITDELNKIPENNPKDRARVTNPMKFYHGKGCDKCQNGYRGRIGIYEVMAMSEKVEQLAIEKASAASIQAQAIKEGMITMKQDGLLKALIGMTTVDEVLRETSE